MRAQRVAEIVAEVKAANAAESLPQRLCIACAEALPVTGVGLVFMNESGPIAMVAATDGPARQMEDLQLVLGEGPCVDASQSGRPVLEPDLESRATTRWPNFGPAVLRAGIAAIFAFPLQVGAIRLGVLDLYRDEPGMLSADELSEALAFADAAVEVIIYLQGQVRGETLHPELSGGFSYSPIVHQSTGMISMQAQVDIGAALVLLRARAYATDRPVAALAQDVIDRKVRWDRVEEH